MAAAGSIFILYQFFICSVTSSFVWVLLPARLELYRFKDMAFGGWRISVEASVAVNLHHDSSILPRSVSDDGMAARDNCAV